jgi:hypothetical protein
MGKLHASQRGQAVRQLAEAASIHPGNGYAPAGTVVLQSGSKIPVVDAAKEKGRLIGEKVFAKHKELFRKLAQ